MTTRAVARSGFGDPHCVVAFQTLAVVGTQQTRLEQVLLIKRFAVAASTGRWFGGYGAVVVAALAKRALVSMKMPGQRIVFDLLGQGQYDFAMGKLHRFILVAQSVDDNFFRNFFSSQRASGCRTGIKHFGSRFGVKVNGCRVARSGRVAG